MLNLIRRYLGSTVPAQSLVEYGLLLALIAVVVVVALIFLGPVIADLFTDIGIQLDPIGSPPPPAP